MQEYQLDSNMNLLRVYALNNTEESVYFDDIRIQLFNTKPVGGDGLPELNLNLAESDFKVLKKYAKKSRERGLIKKSYKSDFKGTIEFDGRKLQAKIRLKGDWADHVKKDKWSFRIKSSSSDNYKGLQAFSVQSPSTRSFMHEWAIHEAFRELNIITTSYDFIKLNVNEKNWGCYAVESHFDKILLESQGRREGPILKFNEKGVWERNVYNLENKRFPRLSVFESSIIEPFKKGRTLRDTTLSRQFEEARNLMEIYRSGEQLDKVLDLDLWAKYYAICELFGVDHNLIWHNQRVYFNPITNLLEPIGFDCYADNIYRKEGTVLTQNDEALNLEVGFPFLIKNNPAFHEKFTTAMETVRSPDFLNKLIDQYEALESSMGTSLGNEFDYYDWSTLPPLLHQRSETLGAYYENFSPDVSITIKDTGKCNCDEWKWHFKSVSVNGYLKGNGEIDLECYRQNGVTVLGYAFSKTEEGILFDEPIELEYGGNAKVMTSIAASHILFKYPDSLTHEDYRGRTFRKKITLWENPQRVSSRADYEATSVPLGSIFNIKGTELHFKNLRHVLKQHLYIPEGYTVVIDKPVHIDLKKGASIVSASPVVCLDESNTRIYSSDGRGQGLHILAANSRSIIQNLVMENQSTLNYKNWRLTGALTIYRSDISVKNLSQSNIRAEDALNLVGCTFNVEEYVLEGSKSDGIDIDFGTGNLTDLAISNTGNDGLDISGAQGSVGNSSFKNCGDKGISFGESCMFTAKECSISDCLIGVASKDKSSVTIEGGRIQNCKTAISCYQKKPEFGPSNISLSRVKFIENTVKAEADDASKIEIGGKIVKARKIPA